jgi:cytochrome P450
VEGSEEKVVDARGGDRSPEALAATVLENPGGLEDPQALLQAIRSEQPICPGPGGTFLVSGYEEIRSVYVDHSHFSSAAAQAKEADLYDRYARSPEEAKIARIMLGSQMFTTDEPEHSRLRSVARDAFSPKTIAKLRPMIDEIVDDLIADVQGLERFDVVRRLGYPLPEKVICEILGAPFEDFHLWEAWGRVVSELPRTREPNEAEILGFIEVVNNFNRYFKKLIEERRAHAGDDLISAMIVANTDDLVSDEELVASIMLFVVGGHDTTANMVTNGLYWLLKRPEQYALLREDPDLVPSAVQEMLRYEPSAPFPLPRCALEDTEVAGVMIPAGSMVLLADHGAGRDPRRYEDPESFDVTRYVDRSAAPHLAFGFGIHRCIGEHLARHELESMFTAIVRDLPELELIERGEWHDGFFRHLEELVVAPKQR